MSLLSLARNKIFWMLDRFRGGRIAKAYNEIMTIDHLNSDDPRVKAYQDKALELLINRACDETVYYHDYLGCSFEDFPIINKNTIRENQDNFISNKYKKDSLITMSTSGSTGTPFVCYQNIDKKNWVNAEVIYYSEKVGYRLGDNLSYIRTIVKQNQKSRLKQFMQNQTLIQCFALDDDGIRNMIDELKRKKGPVTVLGYGSTYTAIKDYAKRKNVNHFDGVHVVGVISGSDMLFDETRDTISKLLGDIPVVSRYSNEENGVLGQDEGLNNVFSINEACYIVEICDDAGRPVDDGQLGHIVVTDLYNYAMPMIRYDTGDMGAIRIVEINGRKKKCIYDFSGRSVDVIYNCAGKALSPHTITNKMWDYPEINQFQIIQTGQKNYTVKLNLPDGFSREVEIQTILKDLFGDDAILNMVYVNEIPVLASGKRRYIVNDMSR